MIRRLLAASLVAMAWNRIAPTAAAAAAELSLFEDSAASSTDEPAATPAAPSPRLHTPHHHRHVPAFDAAAPNCTIGVDLATPSSLSAFQCMAQQGIQQATIRAFQSNCWLDPHAPATIQNAWDAGLSVDIYIFPSVGCELDPVSQIDLTLDHLAENNATFRTLWIDVEDWSVRLLSSFMHTAHHSTAQHFHRSRSLFLCFWAGAGLQSPSVSRTSILWLR